MHAGKRVGLFLSIAMLLTGTARAQLTCNGALVCNSSTPSYTFTNNGSGNVLQLTTYSGNALNITSNFGGTGLNFNTSGSGNAVNAVTNGTGIVVSAGGAGVDVTNGSNVAAAVEARANYYHGIDVTAGWNTTGLFHGVKAVNVASSGTGGYGVYGESKRNTGVYGKALLAGQYGVYANGNLGASGTKTFVEPHPYDATKQIHYAALEGPEAGTYFRGTSKTVKGIARITVPEDFRIVTADAGLTVHVTPLGQLSLVACIRKDLNEIVIQSTKDVEFDYIVHGVRKAFADFQPIVENTDFVPEGPEDALFIAGLPAESVARLKANGTLNDDGSVNVRTAERMGWDKRDFWRVGKDERSSRLLKKSLFLG